MSVFIGDFLGKYEEQNIVYPKGTFLVTIVFMYSDYNMWIAPISLLRVLALLVLHIATWFTKTIAFGRHPFIFIPYKHNSIGSANLPCPMENGFCLNANGHDQNSGVIKLYATDVRTDDKLQSCLATCRSHSGAKGCEAIWGEGNRGCYVHTGEVSKGNGAGKHFCWVLKKCSVSGK